ncbi:MAG: hypothetical protein ACK55Z_21750, partial [bacterium]
MTAEISDKRDQQLIENQHSKQQKCMPGMTDGECNTEGDECIDREKNETEPDQSTPGIGNKMRIPGHICGGEIIDSQ